MTYPGQSFGDPGSVTRNANVVLNADVGNYSAQMSAAAQQTNSLSSSVDGLAHKLGGLDKWAGRKLFHFAAADFAMLGGATADAATFEKQLSTLSATAAVTNQDFRGLKSGIESTFTKFGVSRGEVIALTEAISDLGVTGDRQITSLTRTFLKLGAATGENSAGLAQGLIQLSRMMGVTDATQIGNMANSLLTVSKNAGVSATGVLEFAQAIAPMGRQLGIGEAAIFGFSAAFKKAGADGYYAANTFNTIISNISQAIATNSPDLSKYANLIGVTQSQFRKMDKTNAMVEVMDQLTKLGPRAVSILDSMGVSGVRGQAAIAAVSQSGDLREQISTALGAQGNQHNLNKGAEAAFNNLADSVVRAKNAFAEFGTILGTTFLTPLTKTVNVIGNATNAVTRLIKPFSTVIGLGAGVLGGMGALGGVAMNAAGIIGSIALARMVMRGTHAASFSDAVVAARGGPMSKRAEESQERFTGSKMSRYQEFMYRAGLGVGGMVGPVHPLSGLSKEEQEVNRRFVKGEMSPEERKLYSRGVYAAQDDRAAEEKAERERAALARRKLTPGERPAAENELKQRHAAEANERLLAQQRAYEGMAPEEKAIYGGGRAFGGVPVGGTLTKLSTWRNLGIAAVPRAIQALNAGQAAMLRESTRGAWDRLRYRDEQPRIGMGERFNRLVNQTSRLSPIDVVGQEGLRTLRGVGDLSNAYVNAGASQIGPVARSLVRYAGPRAVTSMIAGFTGIPFARSITDKTMFGAKGPQSMEEATANLSKKWQAMGAAMAHPLKAFGELAKSAGSTAIAVRDLGVKAGAAGLGAVAGAAGTGISKGVGLAWQGAKSAVGAAFSLPGMIALSAGMEMFSHNAKSAHQGDDKFLNPIQQYNDLLGTTTTNLANFSQALADSAGALGGHAVTLGQAMDVSQQDQSSAPNKVTNPVFSRIKQYAHSDAQSSRALAAVFGSMQITDPRQLQAAKEDAFASGLSFDVVNRAMGIYRAKGGPDKTSGLGRNVDYKSISFLDRYAEAHGHVWGIPHASKGGAEVLDTVLTGIDAQRQSDSQTKGAVFGQQKALIAYSKAFQPVLDTIKNSNVPERVTATSEALAKKLQTIAGGGSVKAYQNFLANQVPTVDLHNKTQSQQFIVDALGQTAAGRRWLGRLTEQGAGGTTNAADFSSVLAQLGSAVDPNSFNGLLRRRGGALGSFSVANQTLQQALANGAQGAPGVRNAAVDLLLDKATKLGGGFAGATGELTKFMGAIGDSTNALYQAAQAAEQMAVQEMSYRAPFQTRAKNFSDVTTSYQSVAQKYAGIPKDQLTDEQRSILQDRRGAYEQALGDQQQYLQQMYQTALQSGVQNKRAKQDELTQERRGQQDHDIQMLQMQQDYQRSVQRSIEDHNRQLENQAEQSAQSIYNPYLRVQAKYTASSGAVMENMADTNARMAQQLAEVRKMHKMGLSTQAIQTLDLANPDNAQQTNRLLQDFMQNPNTIAKINTEAAKRLKDTKALTQNPFVLSFQQGEQEFHIQLERGQQDYQRSVDRADEQFSLSMGRLQRDYQRSVDRAGEDLTTAMREVTGNFGAMYDKTMAQIANSVAKYSPKAAAQMSRDLEGLIKKFPFLQYGDASQYHGMNVTTAGTIGINPKGQIGYYSGKGQFVAVPYQDANTATLPYISPPGSAPKPAPHKSSPRLPGHPQAEGGITIGPQMVAVSEWAPNARELHVPLNRGASYFAPLAESVSRAVLQQLMTSGRGMPGMAASAHVTISEDHSTNFTGDICVKADDPREMARKLAAQARLKKLATPPRHGG